MTGHCSQDILRRFAAGTLSPTELLEVDDHIAACETCRADAARLGGAGPALEGLSENMREPSVHLSDEEVQLFVEGRLPGAQTFEIRRHLTDCDVCRRQVAELSAWTRSPRRWQPALAVAAAAAVLVIGVLTGRMWHPQNREPQLAAVPDVLGSLSTGARARVESALHAGSADLPPFMTDLAPPRETLMGTSEGQDGFDVTTPVATAVVEDTPEFAWQSLAGDGGYIVTVLDDTGREVVRSPAVTESRWTPTNPLPRDRTYTWQVSAERSGRNRIAPAPPAPPARFRVLDAATATELQRVSRKFPDAHAVLGILYMEAGVRARAIVELGRVRPGDPYMEVARKSLARLQAAAPPSRGDPAFVR